MPPECHEHPTYTTKLYIFSFGHLSIHTVIGLAISHLEVYKRIKGGAHVDVSYGLVNGAIGHIVHIVTDSSSEVSTVLVKFDNQQVGL